MPRRRHNPHTVVSIYRIVECSIQREGGEEAEEKGGEWGTGAPAGVLLPLARCEKDGTSSHPHGRTKVSVLSEKCSVVVVELLECGWDLHLSGFAIRLQHVIKIPLVTSPQPEVCISASTDQ